MVLQGLPAATLRAHSYSVFSLSLSLSSDEQEKYLSPSICQITHTVDSTNHSSHQGRKILFLLQKLGSRLTGTVQYSTVQYSTYIV